MDGWMDGWMDATLMLLLAFWFIGLMGWEKMS